MITNDWMSDIYRIADPGEVTQSIVMPVDTDQIGSFESTTVMALVETIQGIGVVLDVNHLLLVRPSNPQTLPTPPGTVHWLDVPYGLGSIRLRIRWDGTTVTTEYSLSDGAEWIAVDSFPQLDDPLDCFLYYSHVPGRPDEEALYYQTRTLNGVINAEANAIQQTITAPAPPAVRVGNPTQTAEPIVHALVGAQLGDLEFDTGTSVRWTQWFTSDVFITDVNDGNQRYWVVNWDKTFPQASHVVTSKNFFNDPVSFRKQQWSDFLAYSTRTVTDDDWVLFVDTHEGLSADTRSPPTNVDLEPFRAYIAREVARAGAGTSVCIPFFVYLRHGNIQNVYYDQGNIRVEQAAGVPYYLAQQGLVRLVKVSALKNVAFNWASIDTPSAASAGVKVQIVSYGYAHWQALNVPAGSTEVPDLDANNDLGWKQRNLLMQARPIAGLPSGTWQSTGDPAGLPGPWLIDTYAGRGVTFIADTPPPAADATLAGILVPLYDSVLRLNLRDGLWYDNSDGNTPVIYNEATGDWIPVPE